MTTRRHDPLVGLCAELRQTLGGAHRDERDEPETWPWACRLLLLRGLRAMSLLDEVDILDLVEAGDAFLGRSLPPLRPRRDGPSPPRAALERGVALLFGPGAGRWSQGELDQMLGEPRALGRAHQLWGAARRERIYKRALTRREAKIEGRDVVRVTQLYTPTWMSRYLVRRSLDDRHAAGGATFLDPACGTGNILLEAFGVLFERYLGNGAEPDEACQALLQRDLVGLDIDRGAAEVAGATLWMAAAARCAEPPSSAPKVLCLDRLRRDREAVLGDLLRRNPDLEPRRTGLSRLLDAYRDLDQLGSLVDPLRLLESDSIRSTRKPLAEFTEAEAQADRDVLRRLSEHLGRERDDGSADLARGLELLSGCYDAVVTNPPYLSNRQMGGELRGYVRRSYPSTAADLYACFIERVERLTKPGGSFGLVCPMGWTTLTAFEAFRRAWLERNTITSFVAVGQRAFAEAGLLFIGLVTARRAPPTQEADIDAVLLDHLEPEARPAALEEACLPERSDLRFQVDQQALMRGPGSALTFFVPAGIQLLLSGGAEPLACRAHVVAGIDTGENARFVRFAWEVEGLPADRWRVYSKGKGYCRWVGDQDARVDWESGGARIRRQPGSTIRNEPFFFRHGLEYSYVYGGRLSCRVLTPAVPDHGSGGVFTHDEEDLPLVLALLNSRLGTFLGRSLSPTLNMPVGALKKMPLPELVRPDLRDAITTLVRGCVGAKEWLRDTPLIGETPPGRWRDLVSRTRRDRTAAAAVLLLLEGAVEVVLHHAYGLGPRETAVVFEQTGDLVGLAPLVEGHDDLPPLPSGGDHCLEAAWAAARKALEVLNLETWPRGRARSARSRLQRLLAGSRTPPWEAPPRRTSRDAARSRLHLPVETGLEKVSLDLGLNPVSVVHMIEDGTRREAWRCPASDRSVAERLAMAIALQLLGYQRAELGSGINSDGRWPRAAAIVPLTPGTAHETLGEQVRRTLPLLLPAEEPAVVEQQLEDALGVPLDAWLLAANFAAHVRRFRSRPIMWQVQSAPSDARSAPAFACMIAYRSLNRDTLGAVLDQYVAPLRRRAGRNGRDELDTFARRLEGVIRDGFGRGSSYAPDLDDGVRVNIAPLQRAGLLPQSVLPDGDVARAIADRARWRAEEVEVLDAGRPAPR